MYRVFSECISLMLLLSETLVLLTKFVHQGLEDFLGHYMFTMIEVLWSDDLMVSEKSFNPFIHFID